MAKTTTVKGYVLTDQELGCEKSKKKKAQKIRRASHKVSRHIYDDSKKRTRPRNW